MPIYSFRNKVTDEHYEKLMSWSAREQYLADNPDVEATITGAPGIGDPVRMGMKKPDDSFRDVLREIKGKHDAKLTRSTINTW